MAPTEKTVDADRDQLRTAIVEVAARLLADGGSAAVTTRAVATEAGIQPPTIYRLFGDKEGLLDAVAQRVFAEYVATKARRKKTTDPVADLDEGWATHIGFGLANPALFGLVADPQRRARLSAAAGGEDILRARVHRVAEAGRLRVTEARAVDMIHAAGTGVVLTLLAVPEADRDLGVVDAIYDAVKRSIITDLPVAPENDAPAAATALRAVLPKVPVLSKPERNLLGEWLDRIADA